MRRPEFFRAEIPILLIPALLAAPSPSALLSLMFAEAVLLFFLLINVGDMINCLFDRDVDLHRKTHLAEAVARVGTRALLAQIVLSSFAAALIGLHLGVTLERSWLAPAGFVGALVAAGYTAPPLRLKSRGLVQLAAYIGLLFTGPMVMVAGVFLPWPSLTVVVFSLAFGTMQAGVLLVNNAEDLDEDEREGIRTAAVVLQAFGTIKLARVAAIAGALGCVAVVVVEFAHPAVAVCVLPLLAGAAWNDRWLGRLLNTLAPLDEAGRRAAIRAQSKHVPTRIEAGAWIALVVVAAANALRCGLA